MTASSAALLDHRETGTRGPGRIAAGQLVVDRHPQLAPHVGSPPDLVLRWGKMPAGAAVDVVVHLHGFSARGRAMNLVRDIAPISGLDLADPAPPGTPGRSAPTLLVLPRGHFHGGRSGRGYSFPVLRRRGALAALVDDALRRFNAATGARATRGRLILTAHSGGGAALMEILKTVDPDEVHAFDALYSDPGPLIDWARRRAATGSGAMRVLFRGREGTAANSLRVARAVPRSPRFRVQRTTVPHGAIPRAYGWRLLADPGADVPDVGPAGATEDREIAAPPSTLCQTIAAVARAQFRRWRPGGAAPLTETSAAASPILREYYRTGVGITVTDAQMRSAAYQAAHPWSAVFISYVMRTAGAGPSFAYSPAHQTYVRAARRNRLDGVTSNPFWAYRADEIVPRVGDLVCASRSSSGATYDNIGDKQVRPTHCDVVTEVRPGRIRVIGGNVGQTVGEKLLTTRPDGRLSLAGAQMRIFAVVSCSGRRPVLGPGGSAPYAPPAGQAPSAQPVPAGVEGRAVKIMELLVNTYRYPVNGAAGLVGNLIAESGAMPERIEGSAEATPMRAKDFSERVRTFTPDEIRDRDPARRLGPKLPGVGLAQWTKASRRAGLFQHTFRGRRLGSAILSDLDAQVDYLAAELGRDYRQVDATLRSPGVTVEQASDVVLLRFEVPAVVYHGKPGDPAVQQEMARRRASGARALAAYRRAHP
jgi:hypothetical protein